MGLKVCLSRTGIRGETFNFIDWDQMNYLKNITNLKKPRLLFDPARATKTG